MRKIYQQLYSASGWWSPLAKPAGWFARDLTNATIGAALNATEGRDALAAIATIIPAHESVTVTAELEVTEGRDTALIHASVPRQPTAGIGGPFLGTQQLTGGKQTLRAFLTVREGRDTARMRADVTPAATNEPTPTPSPANVPPEVTLAPPLLPDVAPVPLPEEPEPVRVIPTVHAMLSGRERADRLAATVQVINWAAYDNEALMVLEV